MFDNFNESCTIVEGFNLKTFKMGKIAKVKEDLKITFDEAIHNFKIANIEEVKEVGELTFRKMIRLGEIEAEGYLDSLMHDTYYQEGVDGASGNSTFLIFTLKDRTGFSIRTDGAVKILKKLGFWEYVPFKEPDYNKALEDYLNSENEKIQNAKYALSGMYLGGASCFQAKQEHLIYLTEDQVIINRQQFLNQGYGEKTFLDIPYKDIISVEVNTFEDLICDAKIGTNGYFGLLELIGRMNIEKNPNAYNDRQALKITYNINNNVENYVLECNRIAKEEITYLKSIVSK